MTLKEEIENCLGDWLCAKELSVSDDQCDMFIKSIMSKIRRRTKSFDVLENIKLLFHEKDKRVALNYGDIGDFVEKQLTKWMR